MQMFHTMLLEPLPLWRPFTWPCYICPQNSWEAWLVAHLLPGHTMPGFLLCSNIKQEACCFEGSFFTSCTFGHLGHRWALCDPPSPPHHLDVTNAYLSRKTSLFNEIIWVGWYCDKAKSLSLRTTLCKGLGSLEQGCHQTWSGTCSAEHSWFPKNCLKDRKWCGTTLDQCEPLLQCTMTARCLVWGLAFGCATFLSLSFSLSVFLAVYLLCVIAACQGDGSAPSEHYLHCHQVWRICDSPRQDGWGQIVLLQVTCSRIKKGHAGGHWSASQQCRPGVNSGGMTCDSRGHCSCHQSWPPV